MSWHTVTHEGKKMYERGGVRVSSTQQIAAIEQQEKDMSRKWNDELRIDRARWDREQDDDPVTKEEAFATAFILLCVVAVCLYDVLMT